MIVIPMVGKSSRFFNKGYKFPKYMLPLEDGTVFSKVLKSFKEYFSTELFVFLVKEDFDTKKFVEKEIANLNIKNFIVKVFNEDTRGQAETVYLGIRDIPSDEPLLIFNIDTFRNNFKVPKWIKECDGYLEVFKGSGENWSYVKSGYKDNSVIETAEKKEISDLCSDGLYYFSSKLIFDLTFENARKKDEKHKGEYYIAPLYNFLVDSKYDIRYFIIDRQDVIFCGTPEEYESLI